MLKAHVALGVTWPTARAWSGGLKDEQISIEGRTLRVSEANGQFFE